VSTVFFLLQMLSKTSVYEVFMHHFEKMSSASGGSSLTCLIKHTSELPLDPAGGLLKKNPAGAHG